MLMVVVPSEGSKEVRIPYFFYLELSVYHYKFHIFRKKNVCIRLPLIKLSNTISRLKRQVLFKFLWHKKTFIR